MQLSMQAVQEQAAVCLEQRLAMAQLHSLPLGQEGTQGAAQKVGCR